MSEIPFNYNKFKDDCKNTIYLKDIFNESFNLICDGKLSYFINFIDAIDDEEVNEEFYHIIHNLHFLQVGKEMLEAFIKDLDNKNPQWKDDIHLDDLNINECLDGINECYWRFSWCESDTLDIEYIDIIRNKIHDFNFNYEGYNGDRLVDEMTIKTHNKLISTARKFLLYKSLLDKITK